MSIDPRTPCLIGAGRHTWHPADVGGGAAPEPLDMWAEVSRRAASDAQPSGGSASVLSGLGSIDVIYCQAWQYDDPPGRLGAALGSSPKQATYTGIGGSIPQVTVAKRAEEMLRGDLDLALVVGGEALATKRRLKKAGEKPAWSYAPTEKRGFPFDIPFHPAEVAHSIFEAYLTFALFDNARRAHRAVPLDEHRAQMGAVMAPMTKIAAKSEHAWFPIERTAEEIASVTPDNRLVAYPYTKLMTSIMDVDMAAAVILATHERADALGVPKDQRVYLRGWGYAQDPYYVAERKDLWRSPAMAAASHAALAGHGGSAEAVSHFDLYSCFASSICFALEALGFDVKDATEASESGSLQVTQTGGLPYHGGPGSAYMTHSMAAVAETLRRDPGTLGLVSGVGMHMTKHVYGLWCSEPGPVAIPDDEAIAKEMAETLSVVPIVERHEGPATVATYSVMHGRDGSPEWAALVCDLPDGSRCYARMDDPDAMASAEEEELIGKPVQLTTNDQGVNVARR